jgi:chemotaxis regulatin CheY-phosphate phosphatase CheZ|tara:strand:- start:1604 stop:2503 length:900 start_codon:yes stop_codon:yes gene_type:complete
VKLTHGLAFSIIGKLISVKRYQGSSTYKEQKIIKVTLLNWLGTMSVKIRKSLVATALLGATAFASSNVIADPLNDIQKVGQQTQTAAKKSQEKIDNIYGQTQEMIGEYRSVVDETELLKVYNDHVARLVADQNANIESLNRQIGTIEKTKQDVVPLMYRMIDTLEQFIKADVPFETETRLGRVEKLRDLLSNAKVTTSEKFRQVLEAYTIETDYSSTQTASQGSLEINGKNINVDFARLGRVAFVAQSFDLKHAWVWNNSTKQWDELGEEYLKPVKTFIRIARGQAAPELLALPIFGAE